MLRQNAPASLLVPAGSGKNRPFGLYAAAFACLSKNNDKLSAACKKVVAEAKK